MWTLFTALKNLTAALIDSAKAAVWNTTATNQNTQAAQVQTVVLGRLIEQLARIESLLIKLLLKLANVPDPGPISILVTGENENMLTFQITLPGEPDGFTDIASGELKLKVGDADEQTIATTKGQSVVDGLSGAQGAAVTASFAYIDDSGNRSQHPSTLDGIILVDTIPPPDPGTLGIQVTGEQADPT